MTQEFDIDKKKLKDLRKKAGINQIDFSKGNKYGNSGFSYRSYQRAEEKDGKISYEQIKAIARFFDKFYRDKKQPINLTAEQLIIRQFNKKIKKDLLKTVVSQSCFLYRVEEYNQLEQTIDFSDNKRQFYYLFNPNSEESLILQKSINEIHEIHASIRLDKAYHPSSDDFTNEDLGSEMKKLERISKISNRLKSINTGSIYLYSGNFPFPQIDHYPMEEPWEQNNEWHGNWGAQVNFKNYAIFAFSKSKNSASLNFSYNNFWHNEKLKKIIAEKPFELKNVPSSLAEEKCVEHFNKHYKYQTFFNKKHTNFEQTDAYELLSDDEINQIGKDYMENEAEQAYADSMEDYDKEFD
jgi:transcriptional regulator with XRE-family HTH domain